MKTRARAKTSVRAKGPGSAKIRVTATEAARKFSEILNRVAYQGESFVVERSGRPVCEIRPAEEEGISTRELVEFLKSGPHPDKGYFDILEEITRNQPTVAPSPWEQ
jgi:prevent-host-death family protein